MGNPAKVQAPFKGTKPLSDCDKFAGMCTEFLRQVTQIHDFYTTNMAHIGIEMVI